MTKALEALISLVLKPEMAAMAERTDWEEKARGILRGEMARRNMTYAQLAERLAGIGVDENERNLRNKVSRGKFTAGFLIQCLAAMEVRALQID